MFYLTHKAMKKKIIIYSEIAYLIAIVIIAFAIAMSTCAGFGISVLNAPAYILSVKLNISFSLTEYIVQGILFLIFCFVMRKFKLIYLCSFITGLLYGGVLLLVQLIPHFNNTITIPGSLPFYLNMIYFGLSLLLMCLAVSLFLKTYLYPQIYDFFIKGVKSRYHINQGVFKTIYDLTFLVIGIVLALTFFKTLKGFIGIGTLIMALLSGMLINLFSKILDYFFIFKPKFERFAELFIEGVKDEK